MFLLTSATQWLYSNPNKVTKSPFSKDVASLALGHIFLAGKQGNNYHGWACFQSSSDAQHPENSDQISSLHSVYPQQAGAGHVSSLSVMSQQAHFQHHCSSRQQLPKCK